MNNEFFKATVLYREFLILDMIDKNSSITQRDIAMAIGTAVSMVHSYLDNFEEFGYIKRNKLNSKTVKYVLLDKGLERMKLLNIQYLKASQDVYRSAKNNIVLFLESIVTKGYKDVLLYGAGEVAEIIVNTLKSDSGIKVSVVGLIDDDLSKLGSRIFDIKIYSIDYIYNIEHDAVFISSYTHQDKIYDKLTRIGYDKNKIIRFFY